MIGGSIMAMSTEEWNALTEAQRRSWQLEQQSKLMASYDDKVVRAPDMPWAAYCEARRQEVAEVEAAAPAPSEPDWFGLNSLASNS